MGTFAIFQSKAQRRARARATAQDAPAPSIVAATRAPGKPVAVDLGISLTSHELFTSTRSKEFIPGSCIAVSPAGATLAMGSMAREMEGRVPPHVRVLQPLQGGRVNDSHLAVRLLENAYKLAGYTGPVGPRVMLQVPASITESERRNLIEAARTAGARSVQLVDQTVAAAVGANLPVLEARGNLVIDLDATSAELALISFGRVLESRPLAASRQFCQNALCDALRRDLHVQISLTTADALIRELGNACGPEGNRVFSVGGRDLAQGLPRKVEVSESAVYEAIRPALETISRELRAIIAEAPNEMISDLVEQGVTLTGIGARLAGLPEYLSAQTNLKVHVAEEPEAAGSRGLRRLLAEDRLRRALLGTVHTAPAKGFRMSPGRSVAAALLFLGLAGSFVPLASHAASGASTVDSAFQTGLTPFWKIASNGMKPAAPAPVAPAISSEEKRRQQQLAAENARLRSLVKLKSAPFAKGAVQGARVIARDPQGWLSWVVLDAGSSQGVKPGMPVVSSEGLVGSVNTVSPSSSRVRLLTHPGSAVAAMIGSRKATGVLYGRNQKTCELRFVDPEKKIKPGDLVTTSGLDGKFPAGLKLGKVLQVKAPQDAVYKSVLVTPAFSAVSPEVLLLKR